MNPFWADLEIVRTDCQRNYVFVRIMQGQFCFVLRLDCVCTNKIYFYFSCLLVSYVLEGDAIANVTYLKYI